MHENGKMKLVETIPGMGRGRIKNYEGVEFNYDIIVRTLVNVTMSSQHNNNNSPTPGDIPKGMQYRLLQRHNSRVTETTKMPHY
jgi:hypothetical protein